jgi:large subunit ribosomal protein L22
MSRAIAITKYVRISPRKARLAADIIRGLTVPEASLQLDFCQLKSGKILKKTLNSAVANCENESDVRRENMQVLEVRVDAGPILKRAKPRNKGGRHPIMKRTSHFVVVVGEA